MPKRNNAGLSDKLMLRRRALAHSTACPVVLETHAGVGKIFTHLYRDMPPGIAFEKNTAKATKLALQRPCWRVYECDSVCALKAGLFASERVDFVDIDPYSDPWPSIDAFLSHPPASSRLTLAVNDGLRRICQMGIAWKVASLEAAVLHFGPHKLYDVYLSACRWLLEKKAAEAGYSLCRFEGFYGGYAKQMTHFYACLALEAGGEKT